MKWLSVKKYKPYFACSSIFVRVEDKDTGHNNICVAYFQDGKWMNSECDYDEERKEWNGLNVTHFCIPDPIEIEEDE
jgi:hypothetical protein